MAKRKSNTRTTVRKTGTKHKYDAFPDRIDLRDWPYEPTLSPLTDILDNRRHVPEILDQGMQGACTGFALAAVINFLLAHRGLKRRVSPRMLYEMARCYDEWPGENYDGSSARGAMKGWTRHGVCERTTWGDKLHGRSHLTDNVAKNAINTPCGAYFRVKHTSVRDVHAALHEVGIVYCTLMVHDGWDAPGPDTVAIGNSRSRLPIIVRKGRASDGHAIALVGYTREGFIVQNSWGKKWGAKGFALLPYEDFLLHVTDVWVAQLGVPLAVDLWESVNADSSAGRFRGGRQIPLAEIRPYVIDIGNNGELSDSGEYWTKEEDLVRLFNNTIPQKATELGWTKKRVMLYLHGGLNSETDVAKRIVAFRDKFLANGIYPLHIMWETGPLETLADMLGDLFTHADQRAGGGFMEGMKNAKDRVLELTTAAIGGKLWSEMKENAWRASDHRQGKGGMQVINHYVKGALQNLPEAETNEWELHVVAHSAGSIFMTHAVNHLTDIGIPFRTLQFLAPAVRIDEFDKYLAPEIRNGSCPSVEMYVLSESLEDHDTVGPYGHSLLRLVSRAFEDKRDTPILGMKVYLNDYLKNNKKVFLNIHTSEGDKNTKGNTITVDTSSRSHGGFDNDANTMNSVVAHILGKAPPYKFEDRDLDY